MSSVKNTLKNTVAALCLLAGCSAAMARDLPADPLGSVNWEYMANTFLPGGEIVFDQRVKVMGPHSAEDQFQVPVTVDATALDNVVEMVALADLNPIPHILTMRPKQASAFLGFRVKLQQTSPVRVAVRTADGVWHVNGVIIDAAGGGCTAPAMAHGVEDWFKTLGHTRAIARRESASTARVLFRMKHPMDTGLATGIPVFHMSQMLLKSASGDVLAELELFEPVSENPTLTLKPKVSEKNQDVLVFARDTEGHEFEFPLNVPAAVTN